MRLKALLLALALVVPASGCAALMQQNLRGTQDLGVIVERASGRIQIVETTQGTKLGQVDGLGDLAHATVNYSRDGRFAYVFGRDGGLSKVDLLACRLVKRVIQAGNSVGGAISQDGRVIAVSNYDPGGVRLFDAATLELLADIPAVGEGQTRPSKVVGLIDVPGRRFAFSLFEAGEIWIADIKDPRKPVLTKFPRVGREPYDAFITADGRFYGAGLFGEDGMALLDLWHPEKGTRRILPDYGRGAERLPVYKMPHLEGWALSGNRAYVPAVGRHEVLVLDNQAWREVGRIAMHGQPVFVVARPDGRQVWVNFAFPHNDTVQVIDVATGVVVKTLKPGAGVMHLEFTPRGEQLWLSVRDHDRVEIYDPDTFEKRGELAVEKPSGIFFTHRAGLIGM